MQQPDSCETPDARETPDVRAKPDVRETPGSAAPRAGERRPGGAGPAEGPAEDAGAGTPPAGVARPRAGAPHVPAQARSRDGVRQRRASPLKEGARDGAPAVISAARGEHTHSEAPLPRPRPAREGVRETQAPGTPAAEEASGDRETPHGQRGPESRNPSDAPAPDLAPARDLNPVSDLASARDLAPASDLAPVPDLASAPDLDLDLNPVPDLNPAQGSGPVSGSAFASAAPRPVIQRVSVRGQILDALRSALVAGDLVPGEVYSAPALGERFGVSATPVREAMQQLAIEGAVEVVPNRGFRVIRRGARELAELAEIRALVEMPVMLRLARTVGAPCWAELRPLAEATVTAAATGDHARYAESDRLFHAAVLALSGNRQLVQLADDLHRRAQWPLEGGPGRRPRTDLTADAAQHLGLLDALAAEDVPAAQSVIRLHFASA